MEAEIVSLAAGGDGTHPPLPDLYRMSAGADYGHGCRSGQGYGYGYGDEDEDGEGQPYGDSTSYGAGYSGDDATVDFLVFSALFMETLT